MDNQGIDTTLLPPQLRAIVDAIGVDEALALIEARGGDRLHVPKSAARAAVLKEILRPRSVAALVDRFGGQRMDVPMAGKILAQWRHQQIAADARQMTYGDVARKYGVTRRWVVEVARQSRLDADDDQLELFG